MSALVFTLRDQPAQRLDLAPLVPQRLAGLSEGGSPPSRSTPRASGSAVGDVFKLRMGDAAELQFEGGSERFDRVGAGMADGEIAVNGSTSASRPAG